jgi:hypothetical protein
VVHYCVNSSSCSYLFPSNRIACSLEELSHVIVGSSAVSAGVCPWQVLLLHRMELFTPSLTSTFIILALIFSIAFRKLGSRDLRVTAEERSAQRPWVYHGQACHSEQWLCKLICHLRLSSYLILGVCIPLRVCVRSGDGSFYRSTQRHYRRLIYYYIILLHVSVVRPSSSRKYINR